MTETLIIPLVIAAIIGMGNLAFKFPRGYSDLTLIVCAVGALASVCLLVWSAAIYVAYWALHQYLDPSKVEKAKALAGSLATPTWVPTVLSIFVISTMLLDWLPKYLKRREASVSADESR